MKPMLNAVDIEGFTPLHLAVKAVANSDNTRPVKILLMKGARRDIRDK